MCKKVLVRSIFSKIRKVDVITSIFRRIQNLIKFEPVLRFQPNPKTELPKSYLQL